MFQNYCCPTRNSCCINSCQFPVDECCDHLYRKRSTCENVGPVLRDYSISSAPPIRRSLKATNSKSKARSSKSAKLKSSNNSSTGLCEPTRKSSNMSTDSKQLKNSQNYEFQDMLGKKRMEVISEEREEQCAQDERLQGSQRSKKIQDSCADFLSIVHDNVVDTVQKSVEAILQDYFVHTMEKIECLCSQMMRNDCLLSKMYLDVMAKISEQNEKSLCQFKCLCQFLAETRESQSERNPNDCEELKPSKYSLNPMPTPQRRVSRRSSDINTCDELPRSSLRKSTQSYTDEAKAPTQSTNSNEGGCKCKFRSSCSFISIAKTPCAPCVHAKAEECESVSSICDEPCEVDRIEQRQESRRCSETSNGTAKKRFASAKAGPSLTDCCKRSTR